MLKELKSTVVHCKTKAEYDRLQTMRRESGWQFSTAGFEMNGPNCYLACYDSEDQWSGFDTAPDNRRTVSLAEFLEIQGLSEELKAGDWVECIEDARTNVGDLLPRGSRWFVVEVDPPSEYAVSPVKLRVGSCELWIRTGDDKKLRKCSPPEEKGGYVLPAGFIAMSSGSGNWTGTLSIKPISIPNSLMDCCTSVIKAARSLALTSIERKYRKLNLKDEQGNLTDEGSTVFLDLLFQQFGKELMDPVVKKLSKDSDED